MKTTLRVSLASIACTALVTGCMTNDQGQLVIDQNKVNAVVVALNPPPPPPPPEPVVVEEFYQPMPADVYVSTVVDRDVVFIGGDTYIWVVGPDGLRHRHFYAHGDHRQDVFHRRDELHRVMANHDGHLPDHAINAHGPDHPGMPGHPGVMAQNHAAPGAPQMPRMAAQTKPVPAAKPATKDTKKS